MKFMRWRWCALASFLLAPAGVQASVLDLQFTDLEIQAAAFDEGVEPWHSFVTPIGCESCDGSDGCDSGSWLGQAHQWFDLGFGDCGLGCDGLGCGDCGCSAGCDGGCDSLRGDESLFGCGIIKPGEKCFSDFISPTTNPVFFEDPRTLTEVRFLFLHNNLPALPGLGINRSNSVQVYAAQVRVALSERWSLIATKDGFIYSQSPIVDNGFADVSAGLKYNFYRDPVKGRLLSGGMTYEIPLGTERSQQGNGDGEFNFFLTGGSRFGRRMHFITATGLREPVDSDAENRLAYWSSHFDYRIGNLPLYAFTEGTWYHYISSGTVGPLPEGLDILNLGSTGVTGNDIVTRAVGLKAKPRQNVELGGAYEIPVTDRQGIMLERWTFDMIFRY
jgi:hypothetical protein